MRTRLCLFAAALAMLAVLLSSGAISAPSTHAVVGAQSATSFRPLKLPFPVGDGRIINGYQQSYWHQGPNAYSFDLCYGASDCTQASSAPGDPVIAPTDIELVASDDYNGDPTDAKDYHVFKVTSDDGGKSLCLALGHFYIDANAIREGKKTWRQGERIGQIAPYPTDVSHYHMGLWHVSANRSCYGDPADREAQELIGSYSLDGTPYPDVVGSVDDYQGAPVTSTNGEGQVPARVSVALIIDSTGSMVTSDPQDLRKSSAKAFVDLAQVNDKIAVVDFDTSAYTRAPLTAVTNEADRSALRSAVNLIDSSGGTNLSAGLQAGYNELLTDGRSNSKAAVLLTDGLGTFSNEHYYFKSKGWRVYVVGLGPDVDAALLQRVASETGGKYYPAATAENLQEIYREISTGLQEQVPVDSRTFPLQQGQTYDLDVKTAASSAQLTFSVTWPGSDVALSLQSPSGSTIDANSAQRWVYHAKGSTYEILRIDYPEPGTWRAHVLGVSMPTGGEQVTLSASVGKSTYSRYGAYLPYLMKGWSAGGIPAPTATQTPTPTSPPTSSPTPTITPTSTPTLTPTSTPTPTITPRPWPGNALELNGSTGYASGADNNSLDGLSAITVEVWVNTSSSSPMSVVSKYRHNNGLNLDDSFFLGLASGHAVWQLNAGDSYSGLDGTSNIADGQWHHLAGVWDGANQILFVDGNVEASRTYVGGGTINPTDEEISIGRTVEGSNPGRYFAGRIDDIRIWSVAKSQQSIAADRFSRLSGNESGLRAYWPADHPAGYSLLVDASGYGNHGTMQGGIDFVTSSVPSQ